MKNKWHYRFLDLAAEISLWSKDPSTKCGAIITQNKFIVSVGYNGFPKGCRDHPDLYKNREEKYLRVLHAEQNAILTARQNLNGTSIYVYPFPPCARCAATIIQVGIKEVHTMDPSAELIERWQKDMDVAAQMYKEANVQLKFHKQLK